MPRRAGNSFGFGAKMTEFPGPSFFSALLTAPPLPSLPHITTTCARLIFTVHDLTGICSFT